MPCGRGIKAKRKRAPCEKAKEEENCPPLAKVKVEEANRPTLVKGRIEKCRQHGHFEKDCRNVAAVTDENEELYDD